MPHLLATRATARVNHGSAPSGAPEVDPQDRIDSLLTHLGTKAQGLTAREAQRRLDQFGPNEITRTQKSSRLAELARQLAHPLALLLWTAAALSLASGDRVLALAIVAVILLNAALAYAQELQAERATEALKELLPPQARVRRDDFEAEVPAAMLVPGDVVLLAEGDRLSADARLIEGSLEVDMAALTGESQPVVRSAAAVRRTATLLESEDVVFAGTLCTGGDAEAVVFATAMSTQLGRIAALSQRVKPEISPLQRQVNRVAWLIAAINVGAGVIFFFAGTTLAGLSLAAAVTFAIGGYFLVLVTAGWSPNDPTGVGTPLHHAYVQATTMTWAGIVACQMGAAFAVRTSRASLRQVGVFSNPHLLRGVAFALLFAVAIIYVPPLQSIFHTAALEPRELIVLACFPVIVWGSDELWRWRARKLPSGPVHHPEPVTAGAS